MRKRMSGPTKQEMRAAVQRLEGNVGFAAALIPAHEQSTVQSGKHHLIVPRATQP